MNWSRRIGYVVLAGVLVSGIATIAPVFIANRPAVYVLAPLVSLPITFLVLFDIASEYELVPESTPVTIRDYLVESSIGGGLAAGGLYVIQAMAALPPVLDDRLLYVAFLAEWLVAYTLVNYRLQSSSGIAE